MSATPPPNPLQDAEIALKNAQAKKTQAEELLKNVEAHYSAIQTGEVIAAIPQVAPVEAVLAGQTGSARQGSLQICDPSQGPPHGLKPAWD